MSLLIAICCVNAICGILDDRGLSASDRLVFNAGIRRTMQRRIHQGYDSESLWNG